MNQSDVTALLVGLGLAGVVIFAYEKGYLKIPTIQTTTSTTSSSTPSSSSTQTTTSSQTTTTSSTQTSSSSPGTVTGVAITGNGSSATTDPFTSTTPSSSTSSSSTSTSSSSSTSTSSSSSTVSTSSSGSGSYPSSSGGTGNVAPPSGNCSVSCSCPSGISGQCYCPNCSCFSLNNVTINNNYNTSVQIEIASEYVSYCNMTQGITWIAGSIKQGEYTDPLPVAPSTSVGGAIYVYPPNGANNNYPYLLNYQFANGNNIVIVPEVDLAPTITVTVTNNTSYNIVLSNVSNLFNDQKVIIAPGQSGSINIGNGWLFAVGTVDPFENYPSSNKAPVMCFNQFVMVGNKPAINFINDQDYNTCSQYSYTVNINGVNYSGNMGSGLNYNVEQVNYNSTSTSSSSSTSSTSTSSTSTSSTKLYGGVKPRMVPY